MGRNKSFDRQLVIQQISKLFVTNGFNATSLDEIVKETGLLRGSLYSTFGSKLGMFITALEDSLEKNNDFKLGILIVALIEVSPKNNQVHHIVHNWYQNNDSNNLAEMLGTELLKHGDILEKK